MKPLTRRCCSEEGLLLQVTLLLSLAGLRLDLDLLRRRAPDISYAGSSPPHPKCPERDWDRLLLLREVRALGGPYIPSTRLDTWLVHAVAGEENGALPSSPVSGAGGDGPSESGAQDGPSHSRSVRGSSLQQQAQEEGDGGVAAAPRAEPSPGGSDCPTLEDVDLETGQEALDYYYPHKGSEQSESQEGEEKIKQVNEEENEKKAKPEGEERENTDSSTESNRNSINSFPFLEDYLLLQSSQTENALESIIENTSSTSQSTAGLVRDNSIEEIWQDFLLSPELQEISLGDSQPVASSSRGMNSLSSHYTVNLTQAISHDVSLREAMLLRSNHSTRVNPEIRSVQRQESFLQLNSSITNPESLLNGTNLGLFPSVDIRNLTNQDLLSDLDENIFDEINLMALVLEEGFDPIQVSQLFEELDSDSGLSLNSSQSTTSSNNSDSSYVPTCNEGAVGYSSNIEYISHNGLGAVGGRYLEHNKHCHMDYQSDSDYCGESTLQHILHNHTYNQLPNELGSTSKNHSSSSGKSNEVKGRCLTDNLSHDECYVKALRIPFSVDEIVSMPTDVFNNMLSKFYLTDTQISLIRDIRRRGKNKVAAQNCRKRKLDVILNLEDDVCKLQAQKESLKKQKSQCNKSISLMKQKLNDLYYVIFSRLRDDQGRPVNPSQYALHCSSNGRVLIIPKRLVTSEQKQDNQKERKQK
ncbi:nuclear factor erythroid 2-related factor 3 [Trachemys scripta elegans]|uniref:nuclear factor erythroid 2-related factor 3 n=1 Tax=Trachemys scripta elegans TaxID=31138 RepID=UPI0015531AE8|nr:nuclear factor erythroid 2-related factor 3 [Trachemys scripta elegans]